MMKKFLLISVLVLTAATFTSAQNGPKYGTDSVACITNISLSNEYFKQGNYADALEPWRWVFNNCPASTKRAYLNGATMFEQLIAGAKDPVTKQKYVDTLMLIYDQRVKYFN